MRSPGTPCTRSTSLADGMMTETAAPTTFAGAGNEKPLGLAVVRK